MKLPFSVYDFFAYLVTGFVLLCAADYAFDTGWLFKEKLPPGVILFLIVAGYIAGHFVAHISSSLLEQIVVRKVLISPEITLFEPQPKHIRSWLFPGFYNPFPTDTQSRVLAKSRAAGISRPGRGLYNHCFTLVKRDKSTADRLSVFLSIYGFCRNVCMASSIAAGILLYAGLRHWDRKASTGLETDKLVWAAVAMMVAVGLFYRYLKFFRLYTVEVFRDYSELTIGSTGRSSSNEPAEGDHNSES